MAFYWSAFYCWEMGRSLLWKLGTHPDITSISKRQTEAEVTPSYTLCCYGEDHFTVKKQDC